MKRLFYFATEKEAYYARRLLSAQEAAQPGLYPCKEGYVLVGGMGILQTAMAVAKESAFFDEIWNLGIAATLSPEYCVDTKVAVGSVMRPDWFPEGLEERSKQWYKTLFPSLSLGVNGARLASSDYPIHQTHLADLLRLNSDLIDMEGYGLVYAAQQLGRSCFVGKWITDCANAEGPAAIQRLLDQSSRMLADWLQELLENPPATKIPSCLVQECSWIGNEKSLIS